MTGFIAQLVNSHTTPAPVVAPRISGLFEPEHTSPVVPLETDIQVPVHPVATHTSMPAMMTTAAQPVQYNAATERINESNPLAPMNDQPLNFSLPDQPVHTTDPSPQLAHQQLHEHYTEEHYHAGAVNYYTLPATNTGYDDATGETALLSPAYNGITETDASPVLITHHNTKEVLKEKENSPILAKQAMPLVFPSLQAVTKVADTIAAATLPPQDSTTVIKVSIGRIDVRAVTAPPPARKQSTGPATPKISLEEYLNKRNNSGK